MPHTNPAFGRRRRRLRCSLEPLEDADDTGRAQCEVPVKIGLILLLPAAGPRPYSPSLSPVSGLGCACNGGKKGWIKEEASLWKQTSDGGRIQEMGVRGRWPQAAQV